MARRRFLFTLERMSALWPASAAAVKGQLLIAMHSAARLGGDTLVLALDAFRRAAAAGQMPAGLLDDLRPLIKSGALLRALHPAVQLSALALLRELMPELLDDRAGARAACCEGLGWSRQRQLGYHENSWHRYSAGHAECSAAQQQGNYSLREQMLLTSSA